ncbi:hypothetical protein SBV1_gp27 [Sulfolobales Beppu virus 1]|nr:hypothetical protein SBV1_gp27 [Sulfolobales Beppu virus 1]
MSSVIGKCINGALAGVGGALVVESLATLLGYTPPTAVAIGGLLAGAFIGCVVFTLFNNATPQLPVSEIISLIGYDESEFLDLTRLYVDIYNGLTQIYNNFNIIAKGLQTVIAFIVASLINYPWNYVAQAITNYIDTDLIPQLLNAYDSFVQNFINGLTSYAYVLQTAFQNVTLTYQSSGGSFSVVSVYPLLFTKTVTVGTAQVEVPMGFAIALRTKGQVIIGQNVGGGVIYDTNPTFYMVYMFDFVDDIFSLNIYQLNLNGNKVPFTMPSSYSVLLVEAPFFEGVLPMSFAVWQNLINFYNGIVNTNGTQVDYVVVNSSYTVEEGFLPPGNVCTANGAVPNTPNIFVVQTLVQGANSLYLYFIGNNVNNTLPGLLGSKSGNCPGYSQLQQYDFGDVLYNILNFYNSILDTALAYGYELYNKWYGSNPQTLLQQLSYLDISLNIPDCNPSLLFNSLNETVLSLLFDNTINGTLSQQTTVPFVPVWSFGDITVNGQQFESVYFQFFTQNLVIPANTNVTVPGGIIYDPSTESIYIIPYGATVSTPNNIIWRLDVWEKNSGLCYFAPVTDFANLDSQTPNGYFGYILNTQNTIVISPNQNLQFSGWVSSIYYDSDTANPQTLDIVNGNYTITYIPYNLAYAVISNQGLTQTVTQSTVVSKSSSNILIIIAIIVIVLVIGIIIGKKHG